MAVYNGYNFPDIETVWTDKTKYPYAYILYIGDGYTNNPHYSLELSGVPVTYNSNTGELTASSNIKFYAETYGIYEENYGSATEWEKFRPWYTTTRTIANSSCVLIWASEDVYDGNGNRYFYGGNSTVTGISIMSNNSVEKGGYLIVAANVSGTGSFDKSCTATISGASSSTIAKLTNGQNWMLECGTDETASGITVTVTSDADPTITASKTITVVEAGTGGGTGGGDDGDDSGGGTGGGGTGGGGASAADLRSTFMAGLATGLALYSRKG
jgi:hypothetical protein